MGATPHASRLALDTPVSLKSGCKINLYLEITGLLPNGYHTLNMYMVPLEHPHDQLHISPLTALGGESCCRVECSIPGIDLENNTLTKAFKLYAQLLPQAPSIKIELVKGVPHGAGLGGGSADAATLLRFLNNFVQAKGLSGLETDKLMEVAAKVGADVPFFVANTPAWVKGFGDIVEPDPAPLKSFDGWSLVLVCPQVHVSTAWAYSAWDKMEKSAKILTTSARQDSNKSAASLNLYNSLEVPVFSRFPQLAETKEKLYSLGADYALMSGSGSSIFGLFRSEKLAKSASEACKSQGFRVFTQLLHAGVSPSR